MYNSKIKDLRDVLNVQGDTKILHKKHIN